MGLIQRLISCALGRQVGRSVYNKCILGQLRGKTRLLVTNQLQYVSQADVCVFMSEGQLAEVGSYQQLLDKKGSFTQLMAQTEVRLLPCQSLGRQGNRVPRWGDWIV